MQNAGNQIGWGRDLAVLTVFICALFGIMLGSRPLGVPDEARYSEIAREMVVTGDYITPRLNGIKYFEKPVLFYWLQALSIKLFGLNTWSLRIWVTFFALAGCLLVYISGRRLFNRRTGLLSSAVLATSFLYYALSRTVTLDMPVSVLLTASLLAFLLGFREKEERRRRWYILGFYLFAALSTLMKGLIGIVIPAMVIGSWIVVMNEWHLLKSMHLPFGILLFLLVAAPWHILVGKSNPEFFRFYFYHEHFERYLTKVHGHYKPFWFFIPVLLGGLYPWSSFLFQAVQHSLPRIWRERHRHEAAVFLMLWAGLVFLFFSASDSKLIPYILPTFPPLVILVGRYLSDAWDNPGRQGIRTGARLLLIANLLLTAAMIVLPHYLGGDSKLHPVSPHLYLLALIIISSAYITRRITGTRGIARAFPVLAAGTALFFMLANPVVAELDTRPVKDLAVVLKTHLRPGDEVMSYKAYYQDLPVYLERHVTVVNWYGELAFGATVEDTSAWMIEEAEFQKRWQGPNSIYLLTDLKTYDVLRNEKRLTFYPIARNRRTILLSNKEVIS